MKALENEMKKKLQEKQNELEQWKNKFNALSTEHESIVQEKNLEIDGLQAKISQLNHEIENLQSGSSNHIGDLESVLIESLCLNSQYWNKKLRDLEERHKVELEQLKIIYKEELEGKIQEYETRMKELEAKFNASTEEYEKKIRVFYSSKFNTIFRSSI